MMKVTLLPVVFLILCQLKAGSCLRSGPYKASFTKLGPCANPPLPLDPNPATYYHNELYNTSTETNVMRGNMTVLRDYNVKRAKAKNYVWDSNKWKIKTQISNIGCNSLYFPALMMAVSLKYDVKTCTVFKGTYLFRNINLNKIQHIWMETLEYGKAMWRIEVFSKVGTILCYEYETLVEPLKKDK